MYALFIDFKGAFDSINHQILWSKLFKIGLSTKFVKILSYIYSKANVKIRKGDELSEIIKILKGVLQGEILSPILFALFLRDLEEFFIRKGIRGVSATHLVEILLLAYADDIVILSDNYIGMKKIISLLLEYCTLNQLTLNANKSKVILFKKGEFKPQKHF